jgi:hypothetical protein
MKTKAKKITWIDPINSPKKIQIRSGDLFQFTHDVSTRAGYVHPRGSLLYVHQMTHDKPHGEVGPRGFNWVCRTQFDVSIWATLESSIERGLLVKVPRRILFKP